MIPHVVSEAAVLDRAFRWLVQPKRVGELWLGGPNVIVAWLGLFLAVISPPHGAGVTVCWLQDATGLPCLGCGLTRSLSCGLRGMFAESWHYHPMGLMILVLFLLSAGQSLLPKQMRGRIRLFIQSQATLFGILYFGFVALFVSYGTMRFVARMIAG